MRPASRRSASGAKRVRPPVSSASIRCSVAKLWRVAKPVAPLALPGTARHDVTALLGAGDSGEDVGLDDAGERRVSLRGVAGRAFQVDGGEHCATLGDVRNRMEERLVGRVPVVAGASGPAARPRGPRRR
jgi:hypothetical protein